MKFSTKLRNKRQTKQDGQLCVTNTYKAEQNKNYFNLIYVSWKEIEHDIQYVYLTACNK